MAVLRARLLEMEQQRQAEERGEQRRSQVGSGERSEKIRTYNFPDDRVTDHRIGLTVHNLPGLLQGDLDRLDRSTGGGRSGRASGGSRRRGGRLTVVGPHGRRDARPDAARDAAALLGEAAKALGLGRLALAAAGCGAAGQPRLRSRPHLAARAPGGSTRGRGRRPAARLGGAAGRRRADRLHPRLQGVAVPSDRDGPASADPPAGDRAAGRGRHRRDRRAPGARRRTDRRLGGRHRQRRGGASRWHCGSGPPWPWAGCAWAPPTSRRRRWSSRPRTWPPMASPAWSAWAWATCWSQPCCRRRSSRTCWSRTCPTSPATRWRPASAACASSRRWRWTAARMAWTWSAGCWRSCRSGWRPAAWRCWRSGTARRTRCARLAEALPIPVRVSSLPDLAGIQRVVRIERA